MAQPGSAGQRQADLAVIAIRPARPAEAQHLSEIAMAAKASWGYPASFMARCRAALAVDADTIIERQFHLAEGDDGRILGFYGAGFYARMGAQSAGSRPSEIDPARPLPMFRLRLDGAAADLVDWNPKRPVSR